MARFATFIAGSRTLRGPGYYRHHRPSATSSGRTQPWAAGALGLGVTAGVGVACVVCVACVLFEVCGTCWVGAGDGAAATWAQVAMITMSPDSSALPPTPLRSTK